MKSPQHQFLNNNLSARLKKLAVLGATLGLIFGFLYFAPASWMGLYFDYLTNGKLSLTQASGTLWEGSGKLLLKANSRSTSSQGLGQDRSNSHDPELLIASAFSWHISPGLFPSPRLTVTVENGCCFKVPLVVSVLLKNSSGDLVLKFSDSDSNWPAQWLGGLGAPWNTVAPKGTLMIQTRSAELALHPFSAQAPNLYGFAQITLLDLSSQLSTLEPLGTYVIKLSEPGGDFSLLESNLRPKSDTKVGLGGVTLHLSLETTEGRLELTGEGDWINQRLHFDGLAKAQPGFEAALANLLSVLGPRRDNTATLKIG